MSWLTDGNKRMSVGGEKREKHKRNNRWSSRNRSSVVGVKHRPVRRQHAACQPAHPWNKPSLYRFLPFYVVSKKAFSFAFGVFSLLACLFDPFSWFWSCTVSLNRVALTPPGGEYIHSRSSAVTDCFSLHPSSFPHLHSYSLQTKLGWLEMQRYLWCEISSGWTKSHVRRGSQAWFQVTVVVSRTAEFSMSWDHL